MSPRCLRTLCAFIVPWALALSAQAAWHEAGYTRDPSTYNVSEYHLQSEAPFVDAPDWDGEAVARIEREEAERTLVGPRATFKVDVYTVLMQNTERDITVPLPGDGQRILSALAAQGPAQRLMSTEAATRSTYPVNLQQDGISMGLLPFIDPSGTLFLALTYADEQTDFAYRLRADLGRPLYLQTSRGREALLIVIEPDIVY